jgi:uncharacterized protein YneF (UPF0154 family)
MKGGCMESSLMTMLVILVCVGLGFFAGYYYENQQQSHKQIKENFSMSGSTIGGIIGGIVGGIILLVFIFKISADTGSSGTGRKHSNYYVNKHK